VLLLRGPQTPGELRGRTDRMYHFDTLEDVVSTLDRLAQREPPLTAILTRQPGTKESRYTHLFSDESPEANPEQALPSTGPGQALPGTAAPTPTSGRISALEQEVAALRSELSEVQQQLAAFRKQFE
jgi:hypothetical protein